MIFAVITNVKNQHRKFLGLISHLIGEIIRETVPVVALS